MPTHFRDAQKDFLARMKAANRAAGLPTLAEEVARLKAQGEAAKRAEQAAEHTCPRCNERYFSAYVNGLNQPSVIMCGCNKPLPPEENYKRNLKRANLPKVQSFADLEMENRPDSYRALVRCQALLAEGCGWLTMWGDVGNGKSTLAAATANEFMLEGRTALFITFGLFLEAMRNAYSEDNPTNAGEIYERALSAECLVVDELDLFKPSAWAVERLQLLYQRRYNDAESGKTATIWLTNRQPVKDAILPGYEWLIPLYSRMSQWPPLRIDDGDLRPAIGAAKLANTPSPRQP